jgi:hypothetical protein
MELEKTLSMIIYTEAWLRGHGAVAHNLMEDAATPKFQEHKFGNGCIRSCYRRWKNNMTLYKDILMMK